MRNVIDDVYGVHLLPLLDEAYFAGSLPLVARTMLVSRAFSARVTENLRGWWGTWTAFYDTELDQGILLHGEHGDFSEDSECLGYVYTSVAGAEFSKGFDDFEIAGGGWSVSYYQYECYVGPTHVDPPASIRALMMSTRRTPVSSFRGKVRFYKSMPRSAAGGFLPSLSCGLYRV
jgi:hypothetical protein